MLQPVILLEHGDWLIVECTIYFLGGYHSPHHLISYEKHWGSPLDWALMEQFQYCELYRSFLCSL